MALADRQGRMRSKRIIVRLRLRYISPSPAITHFFHHRTKFTNVAIAHIPSMMMLTKMLGLLAFAITSNAQLPAEVSDLTTIPGVNGTSLRFKTNELCETTPGVKSYSGYIDIAEDKHMFFWFFESRNEPSSDPITMFLNGGPGADSMGSTLNGRMPPVYMDRFSL